MPTWLKLAEDDALILRVLEVAGKKDDVVVFDKDTLAIRPYELMTLRLKDGTVVKCDGLERES